jgi:aminopeptidase N
MLKTVDHNPTIYLSDYRNPDFTIESTELTFNLGEEGTQVNSRLSIKRAAGAADAPLVLNAELMEVSAVAINGEELAEAEWQHEDNQLRLNSVPDEFEFSCTNLIHPETNTSLNGLYKSRTMYCSQCEPHGFRRITPYLDRPDVLSKFEVKIIADKSKYPVLLSNGNPIDRGDLEDNLHFVKWQDPFFKPAYLFALVAGDLEVVKDSFTTMSGREIDLQIFVESKDLDKVDHAMQSLKQSMKWDEETYGREYDLDIFMIVAVDDFNMGAMENKGLNIFNTSAVLANPRITTDARFQWIQAVVGHEYFHNWSGNRVTCRDWFQLSLKEGFTVYRDSCFSADLNSASVNRIEEVRALKAFQFAEDASPLAHPVQPQSYQEINNFYTMTVYEKGSEVVRMQANLLGPEKFREATDLYFNRFDGQAVTIEDFVGCISEVSGLDMTQFMNWYKQAGTPVVEVTDHYDEGSQEYRLTMKQSCPATPEASTKEPFVIPVKMGLLGAEGELALHLDGSNSGSKNDSENGPENEGEVSTETVLSFNQVEQEFLFKGVAEKPTPSLLRGFSAPVKLRFDYSQEQLLQLMRADSDGFNRWNASQQLAENVIRCAQGSEIEAIERVTDALIGSYQELLNQSDLDPAVAAMMVSLPSMEALCDSAQNENGLNLDALYSARNRVKEEVATQLQGLFERTYRNNQTDEDYSPDAEQIGQRSLKNIALNYWVASGNEEALEACYQQFSSAKNMTDCSAALSILVNTQTEAASALADQALQSFYSDWKDEALVINQWLAIQAGASKENNLARVQSLLDHDAFDITNPNKVRSLIGAFCTLNPDNFHNADGSGYEFLADQIIKLDALNPQTASRMVNPLTRWKRYDGARQALMKQQLERVGQHDLSNDVREIVNKSLA